MTHIFRVPERGSVSVELVLLAPVLVAVLLLIVGLGQLSEAGGQLTGAARDGARAASQALSADAAPDAARSAVTADLVDSGRNCRNADVQVDTSRFAPGGTVRVRVICTYELSDLGFAGFPGRHTLTATATAPIERYRTVNP